MQHWPFPMPLVDRESMSQNRAKTSQNGCTWEWYSAVTLSREVNGLNSGALNNVPTFLS